MAQVVTILREVGRVRSRTSGPARSQLPPKFSVVLIVLDDLGVEWLDYHGLGERYATGLPDVTDEFQYARTPNLSALASEGVWMSEFYGSSLCSTARARVHTGQRVDECGVGFNIRPPGAATSATTYPTTGFAISSGTLFLAEHLRSEDSNIVTGHFGKWHMCDPWSTVGDGRGSHTPNTNLTNPATFGFQDSTWGPLPYGGRYSFWKIVNGTPTWVDGEGTTTYTEATYASAVFTAAATTWLAARTTQFFCSVSLDPPHMPEDVPPFTLISSAMQTELTGRGLAAGHRLAGNPDNQSARADDDFFVCFRAGIEAMDTLIGRVRAAIPEALRPTTHIVIVGDNGGTPSMLPDGFGTKGKGTLTRGGTNVTMVVYGATVARPGREVKSMCDIGDVYATIAELMGHPRTVSGVSIMPAIRDEVNRDTATALKPYSIEQKFLPTGETNPANFDPSSRSRSITDGRWRLVLAPDGDLFYDTRGDPLELTNLLDDDLSTAASEAYDRLLAALDDVLPV